VRTGAAVGTGFGVLGEGDLDPEPLVAGTLQCSANCFPTDLSVAGAARARDAAFFDWPFVCFEA
jgi:hypothetical protein